jgi:hypothetical protein
MSAESGVFGRKIGAVTDISYLRCYTVNDTPAVPTYIDGGGGSSNAVSMTVYETDPTHLLSLDMQGPQNAVTVTTSVSDSYDLTVDGASSGSTSLLVQDPTKTPEITNEPSGTRSGTVVVQYLLSEKFIDGHAIPDYETFDIPYQNVTSVTTLPNAEKSLIQAVFHLTMGQSATPAELNTWDGVLESRGIAKTVKEIEHQPGAIDGHERFPIELSQLPDYATVVSLLKQEKPSKTKLGRAGHSAKSGKPSEPKVALATTAPRAPVLDLARSARALSTCGWRR